MLGIKKYKLGDYLASTDLFHFNVEKSIGELNKSRDCFFMGRDLEGILRLPSRFSTKQSPLSTSLVMPESLSQIICRYSSLKPSR